MVVFFSMVNVGGINAQLIHIGNGNETKSRWYFLRKLGNELIKPHLQRRSTSNTGLPRELSTRLKEVVGQEEEKVQQPNDQNNEQKRKRCVPCQREKRTRLTKFQCSSCQRHLCLQLSSVVSLDNCGVPTKKSRLED